MAELIKEFIGDDVFNAQKTLISSNDIAKVADAAKIVSQAFGTGGQLDVAPESDSKLLESFKKNLSLLIQKTWVEKSDEMLKEQVLYKLEEFCNAVGKNDWEDAFDRFPEVISDVVFLMFGSQSKAKDFDEYSLAIDPEFGIFWWYISSLPAKNDWSSDKKRLALLVGMFFLANY